MKHTEKALEFPQTELQKKIYEFWKIRGYGKVTAVLGNLNVSLHHDQDKYGTLGINYIYLEQFYNEALASQKAEHDKELNDFKIKRDRIEKINLEACRETKDKEIQKANTFKAWCEGCGDSMEATPIYRENGKSIDHWEYYCIGCDKTHLIIEKGIIEEQKKQIDFYRESVINQEVENIKLNDKISILQKENELLQRDCIARDAEGTKWLMERNNLKSQLANREEWIKLLESSVDELDKGLCYEYGEKFEYHKEIKDTELDKLKTKFLNNLKSKETLKEMMKTTQQEAHRILKEMREKSNSHERIRLDAEPKSRENIATSDNSERRAI